MHPTTEALVGGKLIIPRLLIDEVRSYVAGMPKEVAVNHGWRHYNIFMFVVQKFLGKAWVERHVLGHRLGLSKGAFGFLETDFSTDERGETAVFRLFDLAEMLLNLQLVDGFDNWLMRLKTGKDEQIEASFAELQFAKLLYIHDIDFRFVATTGIRAEDYDFELSLPSHLVVCADAKCKIEAKNFNGKSVASMLNDARRQFPSDKPGIIFVKVPQHWFERSGTVADLRKIAADFLGGTGRIVSVKFYLSQVSLADQQVAHRHLFDEVNTIKDLFPPRRNWNLFKGYHVPSEWNGMPPKWSRLMHFQ